MVKDFKLGRFRLGRKHRSISTPKSARRFAAFYSFMASLPSPPATVDNSFGITSWGMMVNGPDPQAPQYPDGLGDCTIACPGHLIQMWTASAGKEVTVPDTAIVAAYSAWDGYVPGNPSTDNGGVILNVLEDWESQGLGGYKITAYGEITLTQDALSKAVWLFGGANTGVALPVTAQNQVGGLWDVVGDGKTGNSAPGSWGLHCVAMVGYNTTGPVCVTWGSLQQMTWRFFTTYFDEAYAVLSPDWKSPLSTATLLADLSILDGQPQGGGNKIQVAFPPFVVN